MEGLRVEVSVDELFWEACTSGDLETVKRLSQDPLLDLGWADPAAGRTGFYRACSHNRVEVVRYLLSEEQRERIVVNQTQHQGGTPLNVACQDNFVEVVELLLKDPRCDADIPDMYGATPLWVCSQYGFLELVKRLLLYRPNLMLMTKTMMGVSGWANKTAREIAQLKGHAEVKELLVESEWNQGLVHAKLRREFRVQGF